MPQGPLQLRLTVEVDFHAPVGYVVIRLYAQEDEPESYRDLLSLGSLCNRVADLRRPEGQRFYHWREWDVEFLSYLGRTFVPKIKPEQFRLEYFTITKERFGEWRRQFAHLPGRFVNRYDQRPIAAPGQSVPVAQRFVLSENGAPAGQFRIEAFLLFPDGQRSRAHEVMQQMGGRPNEDVTRQELFSAKLPVPWSRLSKYFNRPISTIQKAKAAELLPPLLCNHLELLEGPSVVRQTGGARAAVPELSFRQDGGDFVLQCKVSGRVIPPDVALDKCLVPKLFVNAEGKLVLLEQRPSPMLEAALKALRELAQQAHVDVTPDGLRLPANGSCAALLRTAWQGLPPEMARTVAPELRGLLTADGRPAKLLPQLEVQAQGGLVRMCVGWQVGGQTCAADDVRRCVKNHGTLLQDSHGHWLAIDPEAAAAARERLVAAGLLAEDDDASVQLLSDARRTLQALARSQPIAMADNASRNFADSLLREPPPELPPLAENIAKLLRDYQLRGIEFLADRALCGVGSLLADDMGLGKTLQVLALLDSFRRQAKTFQALVVCPGSVVGVWLEQARHFFPQLPVFAVVGTPEHRRRVLSEHPQDGIFVTHYGLLRLDFAAHEPREYDFLVADEAQFLKNPDAQSTTAIKALRAKHHVALTGTPLENRLLDLWSIMDFLNPGYLKDRWEFQRWEANHAGLARRLAPLMLRRTKEEVAKELPPRTVTVLPVTLAEGQQELYDEQLLLSRNAIRTAGPVEILAALTRLRQLCCDPELLLKRAHSHGSAKTEVLLARCEELLAAGHSVLVFSQFATMLHILERELKRRGLAQHIITGETPMEARAAIVREFQESAAPSVLLLSLKAAGTGLTLTRADYVFLFDPWWNPAAENQAIDRTHRIGQTKPVFAYRLIARGTVEERVLELMAAKRELFEAVVNGAADEAVAARLTREDLAGLLA